MKGRQLVGRIEPTPWSSEAGLAKHSLIFTVGDDVLHPLPNEALAGQTKRRQAGARQSLVFDERAPKNSLIPWSAQRRLSRQCQAWPSRKYSEGSYCIPRRLEYHTLAWVATPKQTKPENSDIIRTEPIVVWQGRFRRTLLAPCCALPRRSKARPSMAYLAV